MANLSDKVRDAIKHFWSVRDLQGARQGALRGGRDTGLRTAVTGGAHLDGFVAVVLNLLVDGGVPRDAIHFRKRSSNMRVELPGYFRAEKQWDLLVTLDRDLLAVIEFKAQVGPSFGNNYNNRSEEALGNAVDLHAAYREGAFKPSGEPWLGYLFLLEDCPRSTSPVLPCESHFEVFPEFKRASYAERYEILLTKLVRERLYDATCLLLSPADAGRQAGAYREPSPELSFDRFISSLLGRALGRLRTKGT